MRSQGVPKQRTGEPAKKKGATLPWRLKEVLAIPRAVLEPERRYFEGVACREHFTGTIRASLSTRCSEIRFHSFAFG